MSETAKRAREMGLCVEAAALLLAVPERDERGEHDEARIRIGEHVFACPQCRRGFSPSV